MTVLSNIITPSNVLTTTNTATVTNKTLTSPTVAGMTVSDGTANGVTYLNGSKVLTSGSALTFDGNTLTAINTSGNAIVASRGSKDLRLSGNYAGANTHAVISTTTGMALAFMDESAEYMRLTSTGLGIGTSSPSNPLSIVSDTSAQVRIGTVNTNIDARLTLAASGTGRNVIGGSGSAPLAFLSSGTELMRLDTSGNLGLGVTPSAWSAYKAIQFGSNGSVANSGGTTLVGWNSYYDGSNYKYIVTGQASQMLISPTGGGGFAWYNAASGTAGNAISFTQAMTLTSGGRLVIGTTSTSAANEFLRVYGSNANWIGSFENTNANPYGNLIQYTSTINGTGNEFLGCYEGGGGSTRLTIRSNGGIANYSANNVNLSDRREKTNFTPAKSYLDVICAIPVQTFNYIDQNLEEDDGLTLGVVAQDVQAVAPELVLESNWSKDGEQPKMRLSIYQTDLQYALMKALQELNAKFEEYKATHR